MLFGYFCLFLFIGWGHPYKMGEILFIFLSSILLMFLIFNSLLLFVCLFFFLALVKSLICGYFFSGWVGVIFFLVFIGGILVIIFYLGLFGKYYSFKFSFLNFFILVFYYPFFYLVSGKGINFGKTSDYLKNFLFFLGVSILLFLVLVVISKIVGQGSTLRRVK